MVPKCPPRASGAGPKPKNDPNRGPTSCQNRIWRVLGHRCDAKGIQGDAGHPPRLKMQPKSIQNGANPKMLLKCSQIGPTCIENELKMHPKWYQVDPRCSQMHQNRFNCPLCWRGFWDFPGFPRNVAKIFKLLSRCSKKVPQSRSERSERRSVLNYILRYLKI